MARLIVPKKIYVPLRIFRETKRTPFEAVVYYLKKEKQMRLREVGKLLCRDERNIWTIYSRAEKKKS